MSVKSTHKRGETVKYSDYFGLQGSKETDYFINVEPPNTAVDPFGVSALTREVNAVETMSMFRLAMYLDG